MPEKIWKKVMITLEANYSCEPAEMPPLADLRYRAEAAAQALFGPADKNHPCGYVYPVEMRVVGGAENPMLAWLCQKIGIDPDKLTPEALETALMWRLDALIRDVANDIAREVNNSSPGEQLTWLVRQGLDVRDLEARSNLLKLGPNPRLET